MMTQTLYARRRGCDVTTVRAAIRDGRIAEAVAPDGMSIADPDLADRLWAERTSRKGKPGPRPTTRPAFNLETSRTAAMAEKMLAAQAQVDELEATTVTRDIAWPLMARIYHEVVAPSLRDFPRLAMERLEGMDRREASDIFHTLINELAFGPMMERITNLPAHPAEVAPPPAPANRNEMEARLRMLQAERMRLERGLREGSLVLVSVIQADVDDRNARLKSALVELRYKVLDDNTEVADILEREVAAVLDSYAAGESGPDLRQANYGSPVQADLHEHPVVDDREAAPPTRSPDLGMFQVNSGLSKLLKARGFKRIASDHDSATYKRGRTTVTARLRAEWTLSAGGHVTTGKGAPSLAAALAP